MKLGGFYTDLLAPDTSHDFDRKLEREGILTSKYRVSAGRRREPSLKTDKGKSLPSIRGRPLPGRPPRPQSLYIGSPRPPRHSNERQPSPHPSPANSETAASTDSSPLPSNYSDGVYSDHGGRKEDGVGVGDGKRVGGSGDAYFNHGGGGDAGYHACDGYYGAEHGHGYYRYQAEDGVYLQRFCYPIPEVCPGRAGLRQMQEEHGWGRWNWDWDWDWDWDWGWDWNWEGYDVYRGHV
ncbi:hypothetical protein QBC34DRAFT_377099 [Podospora aff. communis PSN243]|uniref:Uncharacterized protein n=1 Tax=Podospora aff. communis PSN243 TaxID=3040156 RepID=A0AAV9GY14_9PEZI|nr:hypothetical protein QBC34DRAFT_377099 [Podospora aff. communis PSN243]